MATIKIATLEEDPEFGSKFVNLIKLQLLLSQANSLLQSKFKERWAAYKGSTKNAAWDLDPAGNATEFINEIGQKLFQGMKKIQKGYLKSGIVDSWDVTTHTDVLTQVDFGQPPDKQERRMLELLKQVRNKMAHSPKAGISDLEFENLWTKAEKVLIYFGYDVQDIQKLKLSTNVSEFDDQNASTFTNRDSQKACELKENGNNLFRASKFVAAIDKYTEAIGLEGLSHVDRGALYSNRSSAYLSLLKDKRNMTCEDASHRALEDAKEVIRLRPAWYKGYVRAGNAYHASRKYDKAVRSFDWALSLLVYSENMKLWDEIKVARDASRMKLGMDARNENMDPGNYKQREYMQGIAEEKLGQPITDKLLEQVKEFRVKQIPSQADVYKGHDYRDGTGGMKQDLEASVRFYTRAAAAGNAEGMHNLSMSYKYSRGVQRDFGIAIKLLKEAASKPAFRDKGKKDAVIGVAEAEHALGLAYDEGVGVDQDYGEALKWYQKGSEHGCSNASNNLAFMYRDGKGVPRDFKRAGQYWHLSATQHNPLAMESFALYCLLERDPAQARHWHEKAIAIGNIHAKLNKSEFDAAVMKVEEENRKAEKTAAKPEAEQGLKRDGQTLNERLKNIFEEVVPDINGATDESNRSDVEGAVPKSIATLSQLGFAVPVVERDVNDQSFFSTLTAPVRVKFIKEYREAVKSCAKDIRKVLGVPLYKNTFESFAPRHKQAAPTRLVGLRSITFRQMDVHKDQVYENCVLAVQSIEDPGDVRRPSIMLLLEDDNRDVCRAFIYNFAVTTHKEVLEQLGYGAKLSIINPYMRLAADGGYGLRVDDPSTLFLHTRHTPTACRFCGKPNAQLKCGKCKRAFYCGPKCQEVDWETFKHKLICGPMPFQ